MAKNESGDTWTRDLRQHVAERPIVIRNIEEHELQGLKETSQGMRQFSLSRVHDDTRGVVTPCICIFFAERARPFGGLPEPAAAYAAVFKDIVLSMQLKKSKKKMTPSNWANQLQPEARV